MMKDELDRFYTKDHVVDLCLQSHDFTQYGMIIDPSCGQGAFSKKIPNPVSIDIDESSPAMIHQSWLDYEVPSIAKDVLVIGNPPFGKRGKLIDSFISHAISFKNVSEIAFILPNVYKKFVKQKIFPHEWHLFMYFDLPKSSFTFDGKDYHVPCSFFRWGKDSIIDLRSSNELIENEDWYYCDKKDAMWFVFGAAPNKVILPDEVAHTNRGYYLTSNVLTAKELKGRLIETRYTGHSSVNGGVSWLTKSELNNQYCESRRLKDDH